MAKKGMKRPEITSGHPKNDVSPVPQLQGKAKSAKKKAKVNTPIPSVQIQKSTITCKNCGQELPPDSVFCHICGTKIEKES